MTPSKNALFLGVVIGVLLSGIAALAAFVYFEMPPMIESAFADRSSTRYRIRAGVCDQLAQLGDRELTYDFARFANRHAPDDQDIMLGRKTDDEVCSLAMLSLARNLPAARFGQVVSCVPGATSPVAARDCFDRE